MKSESDDSQKEFCEELVQALVGEFSASEDIGIEAHVFQFLGGLLGEAGCEALQLGVCPVNFGGPFPA